MDHTTRTLSLSAILLLLGIALVWGFNFIMVKVSLLEIKPLTLCALRFFLASIPAIFFVPKPKTPWAYIISYGLLTFALQFSLLFMGMASGVPAGIAALVLQLQVFFAMFFACFFAKQTLTVWQILGAIISFSGIALIGIQQQMGCSFGGFILLLSAAMSWGLGNVISVKMKDVNMFGVIVWSSFVAFFPLSIAAYLLEDPIALLQHPGQLSTLSIFAVAYITYASTHFGYGCWSWLLSKYPTGSIAPFALLCPIIALFFSAIFLHETFGMTKMLAAGLVTLGLCLNLFGYRVYRGYVSMRLKMTAKNNPLPTSRDLFAESKDPA